MSRNKKSSKMEILEVDYDVIKRAAEERLKNAINDLEHKASLGAVGPFFRAIVGYETAKEECQKSNNGLYDFNGSINNLNRGRDYIKRVECIMQEVGGNYWLY
ncbi:hypothetical protein HYT23_05900 [Candidatus Pacearchaeota archaeon]|nr:hypothetical protein [Candidatus Pacearchaeota archaeon]